MPTFTYIALDRDGKRRSGQIRAPSKAQAEDKLYEEKLNPIAIDPVKEQANVEDVLARFKGIKLDSLVYFTRQLATMMEAQMPVPAALKALEEQEQNPKFKDVIGEVIADVEDGKMLCDAFAKHPLVFETLYVAMVRAGEKSGSLPKSLKELANQLEKQARLRKAVKSATIYPKVVLIVAFLIVSALLMTIVPTFANIFEQVIQDTYDPSSGEPPPDASLPFLTQVVVDASHFLYPDRDRDLMWWGEVALRFIGLIVGFFMLRKLVRHILRQEGPRRKWDAYKLRAPMRIGPLIQKIVIARFSRTLSSLLASGVPMTEGLEIVADTSGNVLVAEAVLNAKEEIMKGAPISEPLARSGVFPATVVHMIRVGDETGDLQEMLSKVADFFEEEVDTSIKGLTSLIEPLMILVVGGAIGVIIIAIYLPIFEVYNKVGALLAGPLGQMAQHLLSVLPL